MHIILLQQKIVERLKKCKMKKLMLLSIIACFASCKQNGYRFVILEYSVKNKDYIVKINDPVKLEILQKGISSLKQESIVIPIAYGLKIGLKNGDTLQYWCNGSVMMDSSRRFYMPKGKSQKDFIQLLKSIAPGMPVDEDPGGL